MRFVIVTGMSGAGKSTALKMLEDMEYFCVDNLPVPLIDKFVQLIKDSGCLLYTSELIYLRFFKESTQTSIAQKMGMSQVQVSRMEKKILQRMREAYFSAI